MKIKKILSLVLAAIMVLAMAVPAFATDNTAELTDLTKAGNVKISGETNVPTISVKVPSTGAVVVNPFKLAYTPDGGTESTDQVISAVQYINSVSDIDLWVTGTVTGTVGGELKLLAQDKDDWTTASKTKDVFLYFEVMAATNGSTAPTWAASFDAEKHAVVAAAKAVSIPAGGAAKLAKKTSDTDTTGSFAAFHLVGKAQEQLTTGAWTNKDTVSVAVAFTFATSDPAANS